MGGLSYITTTVGVLVLAISGCVLCIGRRAAEELEAWFPHAHLLLKHPGIGLGIGIALFIVGTTAFGIRSNLLRTAPRR
jgi:hypothetical protein